MKLVAIDFETTGLDPHKDRVRLVQMFDGKKVTILDVFESSEVLDEIVLLCEDSSVCKIFHNAKFDLSFIRARANRRVRYSNIWDTMLAEQVLMAGWSYPYWDKKTNEMKKRLPEFNLAALVSRHLGFKLDKDLQKSNWGSKELTEAQLEYAANDVKVLIPLYTIQQKLLELNNLLPTAMLEFDTLSPIIEIEWFGMPVDWEEAEKLRVIKKAELEASKTELEKEVRRSQKSTQMSLFGDYAGIDVNLNSPVQVTKYLKEKLGYEVDSSDVETLKSIDHPFAEKLLKFRTLEKHLNFIDQFESFGAKTGRLYPYYNQCRAATGRMSSSKPNGQQIPKRGDGKVFRKLFKATPGYKLVKIDFAAIEMRVMARLAKDKEMMNAIANGIDLHRLTASKTALKAMDEVTKEDRQRAKAVNFGLIYGMSAPTLQKYAYMNYGVKMTPDEAVQTRDRYFDLYKGIAKWHTDQKTAMYTPRPYNCHSHDKGYYITYVAMQQTLTGRKRFWANYAGETIAKPTEFFNSADQGTSADITKLALIKLYQMLPSEAHIIAAIHDEVLVEVPEDMATMVSEIMLKVLVEAGSDVLFPVKVDAEVEIGDSWG